MFVIFPGKEEAFVAAYQACKAHNLSVKQMIWDKGRVFGTLGKRLHYTTENIVLAWRTPEV